MPSTPTLDPFDSPEPAEKPSDSAFYINLQSIAGAEERLLSAFPVIFSLLSTIIRISAFIALNPKSFRYNEIVALNATVKRLRNNMPADFE